MLRVASLSFSVRIPAERDDATSLTQLAHGAQHDTSTCQRRQHVASKNGEWSRNLDAFVKQLVLCCDNAPFRVHSKVSGDQDGGDKADEAN